MFLRLVVPLKLLVVRNRVLLSLEVPLVSTRSYFLNQAPKDKIPSSSCVKPVKLSWLPDL